MPPGTVAISPERQQAVGIRVGQAEKKPFTHTMRLLGRVAADETRIYFINATIDGWITKTLPNTTGSFVKKNETLAAFYSSEFLSAGQALLFALSSMDRVRTTGKEAELQKDQLTQFKINLQQYKDSLRNLGMGDLQIEEMIRTRKYMENVNVTSPADGIILVRNVSLGQRFEKGTELYRIADISRVWILADVYQNEAEAFVPGTVARVNLPQQKKTYQAKVSEVLPVFDPTTRTLKVRLETDNPGFVLRPDMFVDVEMPVAYPAAIVVPADAVLDSGLRKTVFVDSGQRAFRAPGGEDGPAHRRPGRDHRGPRCRRADRHLGQLPHGLGKQAAAGRRRDAGRARARIRCAARRYRRGRRKRRAEKHTTGARAIISAPRSARSNSKTIRHATSDNRSRRPLPGLPFSKAGERPASTNGNDDYAAAFMINRIIDFSVENKFFVFALVGRGLHGGLVVDAAPGARRHPGPERHPGDRLLALGPQPGPRRGPGDLPDRLGPGGRPTGQGRARVLRFRLLLRLCHLRGRHRHLLGALAHPGIPLRRAAAPAPGSQDRAGAGCHALGWVFQYALVDESGKHSLAELRSYQDWYLKYYLKAVPGVAEVAPIGGFGKQYQVNVDPNRLQAYGLSINRVVEAVRAGNYESSGRLIEFGGTEYSIRGRGYVKSLQDLERIAVATSESGTPIRLRDIGEVVLGPDLRRGVGDLDGKGDVVSGIVIMRHGQNALDVIERVKAKLQGDRAGASRRRQGGSHLRPVGPDPARHRQPEVHHHRGPRHGGPGGLPVPLAHPECDHPRDHPAGRHPALLHSLPDDGTHSEHHVSGRGLPSPSARWWTRPSWWSNRPTKTWKSGTAPAAGKITRSVVIRAVKQVAGPSFFALLVIAVSFLPVLTLEGRRAGSSSRWPTPRPLP